MTCCRKILCCGIAGVLLFSLAAFVYHLNSPYRTVYLGGCMMSGVTFEKCPPESVSFSKIEFLILRDEQIAVRRNETTILLTLGVCSIFDADNWNCLSDNIVYAMKDGVYKEAALGNEGQEVRKVAQVPAYLYWRQVLKSRFNAL